MPRNTIFYGKILCVLVSTLITLSEAYSSEEAAETSDLSLARIGAYLTSYRQKGDSSSSALGLWSPSYKCGEACILTGDIGGTILNTETAKFFSLYLGMRGGYRLDPALALEATFGVQNWGPEGHALRMYGIGASYWLGDTLGPFETVRVGFNRIAKPSFPTWQLLLGAEIAI